MRRRRVKQCIVEIGRRIKDITMLLLGLQIPVAKGHRSPLLCQLFADEVYFTKTRVVYAALFCNGVFYVLIRGYHSGYQLLACTLNHGLIFDREFHL